MFYLIRTLFKFYILLAASVISVKAFSYNFEELVAIPSSMVGEATNLTYVNDPSGNFLSADALETFQSDIVFNDVARNHKLGDSLLFFFHYKPSTPKPEGGLVRFRVTLTINGVETAFNQATLTGVLSEQFLLDHDFWRFGAVDLAPLIAHWKDQEGSSSTEFTIDSIHFNINGSADETDSGLGYSSPIYFRDFYLGLESAPISVVPSEGLLEVADFEDGIGNWVGSATNGSDATFAVEGDNGRAEIVVTKKGNDPFDAQFRQRDISCVNGARYLLSFEASMVPDSSSVSEVDVKVRVKDSSSIYTQDVAFTTQTKLYEIEMPRATNRNSLDLLFNIGEIEGVTLRLDRISLREISNDGTIIGNNIVRNGDFETSISSWDVVLFDGNPAAVARHAKDGFVRVNILEHVANSWNVKLYESGLPLELETTYRLSFDARSTDTRELLVNFKDDDAHSDKNRSFDLTTEWKTYTDEFSLALKNGEVAIAAESSMSFFLGSADGAATIDLDNISLLAVSSNELDRIPQGKAISIQVPEGFGAGTAYLSRLPASYFVKHSDTRFSLAETTAYALGAAELTEGRFSTIKTEGLPSGSYEVLIVDENGVVDFIIPFHISFSEIPYSPHYEVYVRTAGKLDFELVPTYYSFRAKNYFKDNAVDGQGIEVYSFDAAKDRDPYAHSWSGISTDDYPIEVRVKLLPEAAHVVLGSNDGRGITLPLQSAKVLPSSDGVSHQLNSNANTVSFTLDEPKKVMIVPNYDQAMSVYENHAIGHVPLSSFEIVSDSNQIPSSFKGDGGTLPSLLTEGYRNPIVFLARERDSFAADLNLESQENVLYVDPGEPPTQDEISAASVVWFRPGAHDLSRLGEHPNYRTYIEGNQIFYLEAGAFVAAGISNKDRKKGGSNTRVIGRGVLTGINHFWGAGNYDFNSMLVEVDIVEGISLTDRANWGIDCGDAVNDIALFGAWHGNNDGLDQTDGTVITDSFLTAHDDNLKLNDHTYAENLVLYQTGSNAHPIMIKELNPPGVHPSRDAERFSNIVVRDIDVIGCWRAYNEGNAAGWGRIGPGIISCLQTRDLRVENVLFSDIRIESPFIQRIFSFYNLRKDYEPYPYTPSWLYENNRTGNTVINGMRFENITVNTPLISTESILASAYENSFSNVTFVDLEINGVTVTDANYEQFFEISGFVNGTGTGAGRIEITNPIQNLAFFGNHFEEFEQVEGLSEGKFGDDDGDGIDNFREFVFGGDPLSAGDKGWSTSQTLRDGYFVFTYPISLNFGHALNYSLEYTDSLSEPVWSTFTSQVGTERSFLDENFDAVSIFLPLSEAQQRYFRLKVEVN